MSPYPAQIDRDTLIATARDMIEAEGLAALSLGKLAATVGVKAPSLYRHIENKTDLLRAVNTLTMRELLASMTAAQTAVGHDPDAALRALAHAYRAYAHAHSLLYHLLFSSGDAELRPDESERLALVLPLQNLIAQLVGNDNAHAALRGLWALLHGFVALELAEQFQRPGSLDDAWDQAIRAYLAGWSR